MRSLFILKPNMRCMRYGIGTYLKQLTGTLISNEDIKIYIVNYLSETYKEFTIDSTLENITEIHIPPPITKINNQKQGERYSETIVDLIVPFIEEYPEPIFQVNYPDALLIVRNLKTRFSLRVITMVHSAQWQLGFNGNKNKFIEAWGNGENTNNGIMKSIESEKMLYEISDRIVTVTSFMKDFISYYFHIPEGKIEVITNGIDNSLMKNINEEEKRLLKKDLGFDEDERLILFSGRLDKGKGLYFLIDAFNLVCKQCDHVRLVIVGDDSGPDGISNYLIKCINIWSKVTFTGYIDYETMQKFYQITDIGIIPSIYDQCPYVALEMMCYNIPIIISNAEGLNEILTKDQCIYLTPLINNEGDLTFSINEISESIIALLRNYKSLSKTITADYQEVINKRFSQKHMGEKMHSLMLSL